MEARALAVMTRPSEASELEPEARAAASSGSGETGGRAAPRDLAILECLRAGDEGAFTALVDEHHGTLVRLALVFVSSRAVAEEVVQETWVGVLNGLGDFQGRSSLKTWIFRILTNRAKTRGVREGRSVPFSALGDGDEDREPAVDPSRFQSNGRWASPPRRWDRDTPERLAMRQQAVHKLKDAIDLLPPNQRAVLVLRDVDGLGSGEVCNVLEISETNQRVLLHRARSRLRSVLEDYVERE
jgi:RNA polymerase sigma-70 factor, ECF subfamily